MAASKESKGPPWVSGATADVKDLLAQPRGSEGLKRPLDTKEEDGSGKKPRTGAKVSGFLPWINRKCRRLRQNAQFWDQRRGLSYLVRVGLNLLARHFSRA